MTPELYWILVESARRIQTEAGPVDGVFYQGHWYHSDGKREARRRARNKRKAAARKAKR